MRKRIRGDLETVCSLGFLHPLKYEKALVALNGCAIQFRAGGGTLHSNDLEPAIRGIQSRVLVRRTGWAGRWRR